MGCTNTFVQAVYSERRFTNSSVISKFGLILLTATIWAVTVKSVLSSNAMAKSSNCRHVFVMIA